MSIVPNPIPNLPPDRPPATARGGFRLAIGRALGWLSLALALAFPVALVINDILIVIWFVRAPHPPQPFPWLALIYTALDYVAIPVVLAALVVGHLALALVGQAKGRRVPKMALTITYTLLAIFAIALFIILPIGEAITHTN